MSDSAAETLKGIINRLLAVSGVTNLVSTRIYSRVPQQTVYPFLVVSLRSDPFLAKDFSEMIHRIRVQVFSRETSPKQCLEIRKQIVAALDRAEANVAVTGYTLVKLEQRGCTYFLEEDGLTWQSLAELDATVV